MKNDCNCEAINKELVNKVKQTMPENETLYNLSELYKVFGDQTRVSILWALETEMCVCDVSSLLNMSKSAVSHQLRILRNAKLVKFRKEGKIVYYSLDDDHVKQIFSQGLEHILERR